MDAIKKRNIFLGIIVLLVAVIAITSVVTLARGPRESSVEVIGRESDGQLIVNDQYEGRMTIPYFDIPTSNYKPDSFTESNGVVTYEGTDSYVGINVNSKMGDIDWARVAESGVDFALIRVGYRGYERGRIQLDANYQTNIVGAIEAGLPVGVYFYSAAVTDAEAQEEAAFVLEQIRGYTITYPIAFYWEYSLKDDGSPDESSRTVRCNGDQITGFIDAFCGKVRDAGFTPSYYCDKTMGYEQLNLETLQNYDMWYAEFCPSPSFYYDFKLWQYTKAGTVPGIEGQEVPITIALKRYS